MNAFVVDSTSLVAADLTQTYNHLISKVHVENDLPFPTTSLYDKSQILDSSVSTFTAESILATQVLHHVYADF
jgi:hypothetical protein